MGCTLHQHGHSHGGSNHQHSHSAPIHNAENQPLLSHSHVGHTHDDVENINVRAGKSIVQYLFLRLTEKLQLLKFCILLFLTAFIHVVGDFVQSLGVFIAAIIIFFQVGFCLFVNCRISSLILTHFFKFHSRIGHLLILSALFYFRSQFFLLRSQF